MDLRKKLQNGRQPKNFNQSKLVGKNNKAGKHALNQTTIPKF